MTKFILRGYFILKYKKNPQVDQGPVVGFYWLICFALILYKNYFSAKTL